MTNNIKQQVFSLLKHQKIKLFLVFSFLVLFLISVHFWLQQPNLTEYKKLFSQKHINFDKWNNYWNSVETYEEWNLDAQGTHNFHFDLDLENNNEDEELGEDTDEQSLQKMVRKELKNCLERVLKYSQNNKEPTIKYNEAREKVAKNETVTLPGELIDSLEKFTVCEIDILPLISKVHIIKNFLGLTSFHSANSSDREFMVNKSSWPFWYNPSLYDAFLYDSIDRKLTSPEKTGINCAEEHTMFTKKKDGSRNDQLLVKVVVLNDVYVAGPHIFDEKVRYTGKNNEWNAPVDLHIHGVENTNLIYPGLVSTGNFPAYGTHLYHSIIDEVSPMALLLPLLHHSDLFKAYVSTCTDSHDAYRWTDRELFFRNAEKIETCNTTHIGEQILNLFSLRKEQIMERYVLEHKTAGAAFVSRAIFLQFPYLVGFERLNLLNLFKPKAVVAKREKTILLIKRQIGKRNMLHIDELLIFFYKEHPDYRVLDIFLEDYTFLQHQEFFSRAAIIISPHGAGLTNTIHCQPGTIIIEIGYHNGVFANIANSFDLIHFMVVDQNHTNTFLNLGGFPKMFDVPMKKMIPPLEKAFEAIEYAQKKSTRATTSKEIFDMRSEFLKDVRLTLQDKSCNE